MANLDDALWLEILMPNLRIGDQQTGGETSFGDTLNALQYDQIATATAARRLKRSDTLGINLHDLEIGLRIRAVNLTLPDDPELVLRLLAASDTLLERYQLRTGDAQDLEGVSSLIERLGLVIQETDQLFSDYLRLYGLTLLANFEAGMTSSELDTAITKLGSFPRVVDENPELLQLHGALLLQRFRIGANRQDLWLGIERAKAVLRLPEVATDTRIYALSNLSQCQPSMVDFGMADDGIAHLDSAVKMGLEAKELAESESCTISDKSIVYGGLALAQYHRYMYRRQRDPADLQGSLDNGRIAADFRISTDITRLDAAISSYEQTVNLSSDGSKTHLLALNNLADALGLRFEWTGETETLDIAVSRYRDLASRQNPNAVDWATNLQNLGNILLVAYNRHLDSELIEEAVRMLNQALTQYPERHAQIVATCSLLCEALTVRSALQERPQDQESDILLAIDHGEEAIRLADPNDPEVPHVRHTLAQAYFTRWRNARSKTDRALLAAIQHSEKCIEEAAPNAHDRTKYLIRHGDLLSEQIFHKDPKFDMSAFATPLRYFKEAAELPNSLPLVRIRAARRAMRILSELGQWDEAVPVGLAAMRLLPLVCGRYLSLHDQQQAISDTSGLASEVCSLLLQVGKTEDALRQLEAGRAMLLGFAMDSTEEVRALEASHPELAKEFTAIRDKLRIPSDSLKGGRLGEVKLRERRDAEAGLTKCLSKIRNLDGHRDFLLEPSLDSMKSCSDDGAVVIVNISYMRSDAIVLVNSGIRLVPLSECLQLEKAIDLGVQLAASFSTVDFALNRGAKVLSKKIPRQPPTNPGPEPAPGFKFLDWLWTSCVRPVFDELRNCGAMQPGPAHGGVKTLPRIWWIGSGGAVGFPFHAAAATAAASSTDPGDYYSERDQDTLSLSISSYTPSIKALLHAKKCSSARRNDPKVSRKAQDLTVITMETTPGSHGDLPAVRKEKEAIMSLRLLNNKEDTGEEGHKWNCTHLPQPTASLALQAMTKSDIIHFACHGVSDRADPSQSHLVLEKPCADNAARKEVDKLTVSQLLHVHASTAEQQHQQDFQNKLWIAFLSACTTASMATFRLADEGLHISGALQIAGVAHVVGSLWKVEDEVGVEITRVFYEELFINGSALVKTETEKKDGCSGLIMNDRMVAAALRAAVMRIRKTYPDPDSWTKWAAYIHSGA